MAQWTDCVFDKLLGVSDQSFWLTLAKLVDLSRDRFTDSGDELILTNFNVSGGFGGNRGNDRGGRGGDRGGRNGGGFRGNRF